MKFFSKLSTKQYVAFGALLGIAVLIMLYIGGFFGQLIYEHTLYEQAGGIATLGDSSYQTQYPNPSITFCMPYAILNPYGHKGLMLAAIIVAAAIAYLLFREYRYSRGFDKERNFVQSEKGTYGTSGWMEEEHIPEAFDYGNVKAIKENILGELDGKVIAVLSTGYLNHHMAVFGASGVGKTRCLIVNQILQSARRKESVIVTDTKGEIFSKTASYLVSHGYLIRVFNLVEPRNSNSWNCMTEVEGDPIRAETFTDVIMKNTSAGKDDQFWSNAEKNYLKALVLYVSTNDKIPDIEKTMGTVYDLLRKPDTEIEEIFRHLPPDHPARFPYDAYKKSAQNDKVSGGVGTGIAGRLQLFQTKAIRDITTADEINLTLPAKRKCAYFVRISDQESTYDMLTSLFFSFMFIDIVKYADNRRNGACKVPVNFILDEFTNIGQIPDFTRKLSTIRSRKMNVTVAFQNIAQLKNRYPYDQYQEILGNCDTQLFLGCTDDMTAKFVSDECGDITIDVSSHQKNLNTIRVTDYVPDYRETSSVGKRKLMNPDEVRRMSNKKAIIFLRGEKPLLVNKFDYSKHPEYKKLHEVNLRSYVPQWRKEQQETHPIREPSKDKRDPEQRNPQNRSQCQNETQNQYQRETRYESRNTKSVSRPYPGSTSTASIRKTKNNNIIRRTKDI